MIKLLTLPTFHFLSCVKKPKKDSVEREEERISMIQKKRKKERRRIGRSRKERTNAIFSKERKKKKGRKKKSERTQRSYFALLKVWVKFKPELKRIFKDPIP